MISKEQLQRYQKYNGDLDDWVKSQRSGMDETLSGAEWTLIAKAMDRLKLQKTGFASRDFRDETERVLTKTFGDAEVIKLARTMV